MVKLLPPEGLEISDETVYGHHRSRALAKRHARAIESKRGLERGSVSIISRRNRYGKYSQRGHSFTFSVKEGFQEGEFGEEEVYSP